MAIQALQETVQSSLDTATKDQKSGIHGIAFVAVNKNGEVLAEAASGTRTQGGKDKVDMETMFWYEAFSIAAYAAFQLALCSIVLRTGNDVYSASTSLRNSGSVNSSLAQEPQHRRLRT